MRFPVRFKGCPPKHIDQHSVSGLTACDVGSKNCVSSVEQDAVNLVPALPFLGDLNATRLKLKAAILPLSNVTLRKETDLYMWFECESSFFGFIDDLEFFFDIGKQRIDVRSASRICCNDFSANRKRVEGIRQKYLKE